MQVFSERKLQLKPVRTSLSRESKPQRRGLELRLSVCAALPKDALVALFRQPLLSEARGLLWSLISPGANPAARAS